MIALIHIIVWPDGNIDIIVWPDNNFDIVVWLDDILFLSFTWMITLM
jgi:hypothetical protein